MKKEKLTEAMTSIGIADFYKSDEELGQPELGEYKYIRIDEIDDFPNHPYGLHENCEDMTLLIESVKEKGILNPVILRPKDERYEMISGHRRKYVATLNNIDVLPAIIKELTDDEAIILMVDTNIYREDVLPSEKAKAYKMRYDAMKHQGKATFGQNVQKSSSLEKMSEEIKEHPKQIQRYLSLNNLIPEIMEMVDDGKIKFTPACEIAGLKESEQKDLYETMMSEICTPALNQAKLMKKESKQGGISMDRIFEIMTEQKPNQEEKIVIKKDKIMQFFPKEYTPRKIEEIIIKLCEQWHRKRQKNREQER